MNEQTITATPEFVQKEISRGRQYFILFFTPGPNKSLDSTAVAKEQMEHLQYLFSLNLSGKMPIFGPVLDNPNIAGLSIFDAADKEEVKKLIEDDAHIKSGALSYEIYTWFSMPGYKLP